MEFQLILAWSAGIAILLIVDRLSSAGNRNGRLLDLVIAVLLWSGAAIFWQSTTLAPNWFVSEKIPPNNVHYPYSDARVYDEVAQSALIGEGFKFFNGLDVRRPLHGAYLTILHLIAGQVYDRVIFLQVLILALLPVFVYFTVKSLHNRASGTVAAILIILREANSISIASNITTSHVKLMMVDLPTALILVIFIYLAIRWLKQVETHSLPALIAGGTLGLAMLIRLEVSILAISPILIMSVMLLPKKKFGWWAKHLVLFVLGIGLVISPWIWRNWQRTGQLFIDSPLFRYMILVQRFQPIDSPELTPPANNPVSPATPPGTTVTPTAQTVTPTPLASGHIESTGVKYLSESLQRPGELIGISAAHFLNNQIQMLLIYPSVYRSFESGIAFIGHRDFTKYIQSCCSLSDYTRRLPYWRKWDGRFLSGSVLPLLVTAMILAIGLSAAWKKFRWIGLMPVLAVLFFIGFYAVLRNSGGRYILPVDWISIVYFSIGLIQITIWVVEQVGQYKLKEVFEGSAENGAAILQKEEKHLLRLPGFYAASLGFFLAGCSIPLIEGAFPLRYPPEREAQMLDLLVENESIPNRIRQGFKDFIAQGGTVMAGRALYPLFYPPGYGSPDEDEGPLMPKDYPRLVFNLTGRYSLDMALPIQKKPDVFPNATDALALFCLSKGDTLRADPLAIALFDETGEMSVLYTRTPIPETLSCPLPSYYPDEP